MKRPQLSSIRNCAYLPACLALTLLLSSSVGAQKTTPVAGVKLLKGWDKNRDGLLQKNEIPDVAWKAVFQLAKKQKLDPSKPFSIKSLSGDSNSVVRFSKRMTKQAGDGKLASKAPRKQTTVDLEPKEKQKLDSEPDQRDVQTIRPRKVKGFGTAGDSSDSANKFENVKPNEKKLATAEKKESREVRRLKTLARSLLILNDKNKSGKLERSEWSRLEGDPQRSDQNKDGVLTAAELADHLAGYGAREQKTRRAKKSKSSTSKKKTSYRFLTPHERLPKGLPDWFVKNDTNFDGQISLTEYASSLSTIKLQAFQRMDLNNDGFVVAQEYLSSTGIEE